LLESAHGELGFQIFKNERWDEEIVIEY